LEAIIDQVAANPKELEQYRNGKTKLLGLRWAGNKQTGGGQQSDQPIAG